jgi:hypothetical protein
MPCLLTASGCGGENHPCQESILVSCGDGILLERRHVVCASSEGGDTIVEVEIFASVPLNMLVTLVYLFAVHVGSGADMIRRGENFC